MASASAGALATFTAREGTAGAVCCSLRSVLGGNGLPPSTIEAKVLELADRLGMRRIPGAARARLDELIAEGVEDEDRLISALTIKETRFFRQPEQFGVLAEYLRDFAQRAGQVCRIWSAACSTGQEAYSIAMVALSAAGAGRVEVLATDVDEYALRVAVRGQYPLSELAHVPEAFRRFVEVSGDGFVVSREVRSLVHFGRLNLAKDPFPRCHVVFCRNVLIYMRCEVARRVVEELANALLPGGLLFLGEGETLTTLDPRGYFCGVTVGPLRYVRVSSPVR